MAESVMKKKITARIEIARMSYHGVSRTEKREGGEGQACERMSREWIGVLGFAVRGFPLRTMSGYSKIRQMWNDTRGVEPRLVAGVRAANRAEPWASSWLCPGIVPSGPGRDDMAIMSTRY